MTGKPDRRSEDQRTPGSEQSSNADIRPVGYRNPPAEHRFRKGQSGNPRGRPRKPKPKVELRQDNHGPSERLGNQLLLEEAYRPVVIRESDKVIELPAIQAVFRAMNVSAMKGNRLAQKMVAEMVASVEEEHRKEQQELFETAVTYKMNCEQEIARCRRLGLPEPSPVPHPDDIVIDVRAGTARIEGPLCPEDKQRWDAWLARRAEAQEEVTYYATRYRRTRTPRIKESLLKGWIREQRMFDMINDTLPERHKRNLDNRTYAEGASRPGMAKALLTERHRSRKG
jgi:hypothetical protein